MTNHMMIKNVLISKKVSKHDHHIVFTVDFIDESQVTEISWN